jgi:putative transposase
MRTPLANDCYYHIYNRGVLKQPIYFEEKDYLRFIHDLYEFNDARPAPKFGRTSSTDRRCLVSIFAWCLMPNHFHLFLQQQKEGGISLFLKKLGGGYAKFINEKYQRSGHVFQGKFQSKLIENDPYFVHLSRYIHLNPLDTIDRAVNPNIETVDFINQYRWSSYLDWIGTKNFPSVIDMQNLDAVRGMDQKKYRQSMLEWLPSM